MKTYTSDGHICTDIEIFFNGESITLQNVVIDTGAVQSILSSEFVCDIGIKAEYVDEFMKTHGIGGEMMFFCRKIEKLKLGNFEFTNIDVDFGVIDPSGDIQGLIGLDLLKLIRAVIDVEIPEKTDIFPSYYHILKMQISLCIVFWENALYGLLDIS